MYTVYTMEPRSSGHDQTGYIAHPVPQQGTWSMKDMPLAAPGALPPQSAPVHSQVGQSAPLQADDGDLIEREWIEAVKKAINENREDPYEQCKALTMLKLQYIKKRYGEDIKVPE